MQIKRFKDWLVESKSEEQEQNPYRERDLLIQEMSGKETWAISIWPDDFPQIFKLLKKRFDDWIPFGSNGSWTPGKLWFISDEKWSPVPFFRLHWIPVDEEANDVADEANLDEIILPTWDIDGPAAKEEILVAYDEVIADEMAAAWNPEIAKKIVSLESQHLDSLLIFNLYPVGAELILTLEKRYLDKTPTTFYKDLIKSIQKHPDYPEDMTDWALGDW
jgi:hypothetical protein